MLAAISACGAALLSPVAVHAQPTPQRRAVDFLSREVPRWYAENRCFSCHNNGDGARALMLARQQGMKVDDMALADTLAFLATPSNWDSNGPDGPFKDLQLARLQFATALALACEADLVESREALWLAAKLVVELQREDGSWPADAEGSVGSPVTYGTPLATALAIHTLKAARASDTADSSLDESLARAQHWVERAEPKNIVEAAAGLLALSTADSHAAQRVRWQALELIRRGQSAEGGWGPFVTARPEVFDTALVILALDSQANRALFRREIDLARAFLLARQLPDGSWPPTTRPSGAESYAQQISTTGWATMALLASGE